MIEWKITEIESYPDTGIVVSANWECSNFQDDFIAFRSGKSIFGEPSNNPIPYENLTENQLLEWIWVDGGVDKDLIEKSITQELNSLTNPILVKNPLPWA